MNLFSLSTAILQRAQAASVRPAQSTERQAAEEKRRMGSGELSKRACLRKPSAAKQQSPVPQKNSARRMRMKFFSCPGLIFQAADTALKGAFSRAALH